MKVNSNKRKSVASREDLVLAALATAPDSEFSPVQVQKLFFLLDQNIGSELHALKFDFKPYHYGPFDPAVYRVLEELRDKGLVSVVSDASMGQRTYAVTPEGVARADKVNVSSSARKYMQEVAAWVQRLSFRELVTAIYRHYPEMKANSVFRG